MIPYGSYSGCYVMSDIHPQQSTFPYNPNCHKKNTMLLLFYFLFVCWELLVLSRENLLTFAFVLSQPILHNDYHWSCCSNLCDKMHYLMSVFGRLLHPHQSWMNQKLKLFSWINFFTRAFKFSEDLSPLSINLFALFFAQLFLEKGSSFK